MKRAERRRARRPTGSIRALLTPLGLAWILFTLAASSSGNTSNASSSRATWRILVYMSADNDLSRAAASNFDELQRFANDRSIRLAVQVDRRASSSDSKRGDSGARRFASRRGPFGRITLREVATLGSQDAASARSLRDFLSWAFADKVAEKAAERTLLVLWGHGFGERGLLADEGASTLMTPHALGQVLRDYPVDVLAMDLCAMQTLEVAQALVGSARFLVGSETARPALGWPYSSLLGWLASRDVSARELAVWLADHAADRGAEAAGSALELSLVPELAIAFSATLDELSRRGLDERRRISRDLAELEWMARSARSIDLGRTLEVLAPHAPASVENARRSHARALIRARTPAGARATGLAFSRERLAERGLLEASQSPGPLLPFLSSRIRLRHAPDSLETLDVHRGVP